MQTLARPVAALVGFGLALSCLASSAPPRALPDGQLPADKRLAPPKDLNGYFPFRPPNSADEWTKRAEKIRHGLRVSVGLYPEPTKCPLNTVVHGKVERDGFTVERVYMQTLPGFYLTGSLYRPAGGDASTKRPGVLCPHGHWEEARFSDAGEARAKDQIAKGAEVDMDAARNPKQARCVHLARLGCTVFHYDMLGYCDNDQISYQLAHRFAKQRPDMIGTEAWGLFSPQAESRLQSVMMLQSWNSVRAIDFLQSLPDVDPERIAVTGASGGGTQTFVVSALDPRVKVSMPAVMVSTAMQGGCTCENSTLMRIEEGNVAFAALFAPKPLGLTTADDWTKEMKTKGFPELQRLYGLLGKPENVMLHDRTEFKHNYNQPSRQAMYRWFNQHLELGHSDPSTERPYKRLTEPELTVWNDQHPKPAGGDGFEKQLLAALTKDIDAKVAADPAIARRGFDTILDSKLASAGDVEWQLVHKNERDTHLEMVGLLNNTTYNEQVPVTFLYPRADWNKRAVIWLSPLGKAGLYDGDAPTPAVAKLLADGSAVCGIDLFMQGEFLERAQEFPVTDYRTVKNPRESVAYTLGYNRPLFVQRLHDVMSAIKLIQTDGHGAEKIDLIGLKGAGHWAAAANFAAGDALDRVVVELDGFRFIDAEHYRSPDLLPGASRYGDIDALLRLAAKKAWLVGENGMPGWLK